MSLRGSSPPAGEDWGDELPMRKVDVAGIEPTGFRRFPYFLAIHILAEILGARTPVVHE